jgi:hypothetical protein
MDGDPHEPVPSLLAKKGIVQTRVGDFETRPGRIPFMDSNYKYERSEGASQQRLLFVYVFW